MEEPRERRKAQLGSQCLGSVERRSRKTDVGEAAAMSLRGKEGVHGLCFEEKPPLVFYRCSGETEWGHNSFRMPGLQCFLSVLSWFACLSVAEMELEVAWPSEGCMQG